MTDCKSDDLKPLITEELLMEWGACEEGLSGFIELFPDGAYLPEAVEGLMKVETEWAKWLFDKCRYVGVYQKYTSNGWRNTGYNNHGNRNTGDMNTGSWNTGDMNTGSWNTGYSNTGCRNTGSWNTGNRNTGDRNTGSWNTGNRNTGDMNTGDRNTGDRNTGSWNTGYRNTGDSNPGDSNTGNSNPGYRNTGNSNTGNRNTGNWNTGSWNTGYFNTVTPETILVFNSPCTINAWEQAAKPKFIVFHVDPDLGYKESWKKAWENSSKEDRELVKLLPNFNADVFEEITGIRV